MSDDPQQQTRSDMFGYGWFGQGTAFWRWVETDEAQPYVRACAAMRRAPDPTVPFYAEEVEGEELLDPDHLDALAARIEREFGEDDTQRRSSR